DLPTKYEWCSCGSMSKLTDPRGKITSWTRDTLGRVTRNTFGDGQYIDYTYHSESGQLKSVKYAKDSTPTITYSYYVDGNLHMIDYINTPASGMAVERDVTYTYDPNHNRVTQRSDDGVIWNYSYYAYATSLGSASNGAGQLWKDDGPWSYDTITYTYDDL